MKKQEYEYINMLMDDEYHNQQEKADALNALLSDDNACQKWHEYHLIRDCLRQSSPAFSEYQIPTANSQKTIVQSRFSVSLYLLGGMAATVAILTVALLFWQNNQQHPPIPTAQNTTHTFDALVLNPPPQETDWLKNEQFYLSAHQQALNEQDMRQAYAFMD